MPGRLVLPYSHALPFAFVMKNPLRPAKFWPTLGFAALAGSRATFAPAFLSQYLTHRPLRLALQRSPLRVLTKPAAKAALGLLAVAEVVGDKLPKTPDRIVPQQVGTRAASGALVGAAVYKANGGSAWLGALVGGLGTVAATYATWWLRAQATQALQGNEVLSGLGEDALAVAGGALLSR